MILFNCPNVLPTIGILSEIFFAHNYQTLREDVLDRKVMNRNNSLIWFIVGALAGAITAVLLAPDSIEKLNDKLKRIIPSGLSDIIGEYISAKRDNFKKSVIIGLSAGFSKLITIVITSILMLIVLSIIAFALIILIGEKIGSLSCAAFIVGGIYFVLAAVLFFLRKRLFANMFTKLFTDVSQTNTLDESWKSLLMVIAKNLGKNLE